jgi:ankyrin repeat protein
MKKKLFLLFASICFGAITHAQSNDDLVKACKSGNLAEVKSLIDKGADVNYGDGAVISASIFYVDVVNYLIEKGAKVNAGAYPPLVNACLYGSPEVIKALLDAGADPNKPAVTEVSAQFQKMVDDEKAKGKSGNKDLIKTWEGIVKSMKSSPPVVNYAMTNLVTGTNCLDCMKMLVEKGGKTDMINSISGSNLLGDFATSGRSKKARAISNKVNADALDKYGMPVPDWYKNSDESKMASPEEIVKYLVSKGVDINLKNKLKNSPLMESLVVIPAIVQSEVIVAMINNGADIKIESILYGKPMLIAAGNGQIDVMEALLSKGANINDEFSVDDITTGQNLKGITTLMWAASNNHLEAVKFLIEKGVNLNEFAHGTSLNRKTMCITNVEGKNAMYYAIESGNIEIVQALLNTSHGWGRAFVIKQRKEKTDNGIYTTTYCFSIGAFIPSAYAKEMGFPEIQALLKSKLI